MQFANIKKPGIKPGNICISKIIYKVLLATQVPD